MNARSLKKSVRALVPAQILSAYHFALAYLGAALYGFPSSDIIVIGVTGTDGKSSTIEYLGAIFEQAGYTTALSNSIRTKIGNESVASAGRSMPGRFFIQRFLRRAIQTNCTVAIVEMTSEGVKQHRHRAIDLNALVFTNLSPEHIESHGSLQAYADAKFEIGRALARSNKRPRIIVANADDAEAERYLKLPVEISRGFTLANRAPWTASNTDGNLMFEGEQIKVRLPGEFSLKNALAAAEVARALGVTLPAIRDGIAHVVHIPGRIEIIDGGQDFAVVVDYALTPEALEALYRTYASQKKICVFGSAGGGRDKWKRPVLGKLAETYCESVILTNDVAYDEDPRQIVDDIAKGMTAKPEIILDRRLAIRRALEIANTHPQASEAVVLITGMGIDSEVTSQNGTMEIWNDPSVTLEELLTLKSQV